LTFLYRKIDALQFLIPSDFIFLTTTLTFSIWRKALTTVAYGQGLQFSYFCIDWGET